MSKYDLGIQDLARQASTLIDAIKLTHRNDNVRQSRLDNDTRATSLTVVQQAIEVLEAMKAVLNPEYTLSLRYLDCCSVDYLADHFNGNEEELISIDIQDSYLDIELALLTELENLTKYLHEITEVKKSKLTSKVSKAAEADVRYVKSTLDVGEDLPEDIRLWFVLTW
jgi:hypothetical protein